MSKLPESEVRRRGGVAEPRLPALSQLLSASTGVEERRSTPAERNHNFPNESTML
jgi:hypothetical protein